MCRGEINSIPLSFVTKNRTGPIPIPAPSMFRFMRQSETGLICRYLLAVTFGDDYTKAFELIE
jgi:hypothetical protein